MTMTFSLVIPAYNEASSLSKLLPALCKRYPSAEILVIDDGSTDNTAQICASFPITYISHQYNRGNGAAIKTGVRAASHDIVAFMDADGQHDAGSIQLLLDKLNTGYDMVVGARNRHGQASMMRWLANNIYNKFASAIVGVTIPDLTSGLRIARRHKFLEFIHLLPNHFSYPTTSTMAFFRAGYSVGYVDVNVAKREGKSHIRPIRDGIRFLLIIYKVATLYAPLKVFLPFSLLHFLLGIFYYAFTYITEGRFTNMGVVLFSSSVIIFLIGLVSEQITTLMYQNQNPNETHANE